MYLSKEKAGELICSIGRRMYEKQFVSANDGNIAMRIGKDTVLATPAGVSKGFMTPDMLLVSDLCGNILEGTGNPTSELHMHLNIYKANDEIMSTCHAHPLHLTALACAGIELDLPMTPEAVCVVGRVPVTPYFCSGSPQLAAAVIPYVKKYHLVNLGSHGPISWGKTPEEAWFRLESAEGICALALLLKDRIGRFRPLTKEEANELIRYHRIDIMDEAVIFGASNDNNKPGMIRLSELMDADSGS